MQYYHDIITEKSFKFLQELKARHKFVLIGGWAVYLYTRALKSKDIDIIIDYEELGRLKEKYTLVKNDRLSKYEIKTGEFDIDIYLPHYSRLGIDVGSVLQKAILKEGFFVPPPEILLMLKLFALNERKGSPKGRKDELDIFSLIILPEIDWDTYKKLTVDFKFEQFHALFLDLLKKTASVKELGLNEQKISKLKKEIFSATAQPNISQT